MTHVVERIAFGLRPASGVLVVEERVISSGGISMLVPSSCHASHHARTRGCRAARPRRRTSVVRPAQ
jgi:hypothetical protein